MAKAGKGDVSFINDQSIGNLESMVLDLLEKSRAPAVTSCTLKFFKDSVDKQG